MNNPIQSIIRKAITDHLVNHVNVGDDKRCRIDILCEQAEQEIMNELPYTNGLLNLFNECAASYGVSILNIKAGFKYRKDDKLYLNLYASKEEMPVICTVKVEEKL